MFDGSFEIKAFLGESPDLHIVVVIGPGVAGLGWDSAGAIFTIGEHAIEAVLRPLGMGCLLITSVVDLHHRG